MTMTYSFDRTYNPWDTEPDVFDELLAEETEETETDELSLEELADEELELEEDFDL